MAAEFEHFVYAWSNHGLEGVSRFQVVAATPRIREAFLARSPLLDDVGRLAYWQPAPADGSRRVVGWQWTRMGMFVFIKRRLTAGHWAEPGGFIMHGFHTVQRARLDEVCAVLSSDVIEPAEELASKSDLLAALPRSLPRLAPVAPSPLAHSLLAAVLDPAPRSPWAVTATSDEFIDALFACAAAAPLPTFTLMSVSSSEMPENAPRYGICGVGPQPEMMALSGMTLVDDGTSVENRMVARVALADPSRARNSISVASGSDSFDPSLFAAVLLVLCGQPAVLGLDQAAAILSHDDAASMALDQPEVRERLAGLVAAHWAVLAHPWQRACGARTDVAVLDRTLGEAMLVAGFPDWPASGSATEQLLERIAQRVAAIALGDEATLRRGPTALLLAVARALANSRAASARSTESAILGVLSGRALSRHALQAFSRRQLVDLAGIWWQRADWAQFGEVAQTLSSAQLADLTSLVETPEGRRRGDLWLAALQREEGDVGALARFLAALVRHSMDAAGLLWAAERLSTLALPESALGVISERINGSGLGLLSMMSAAELSQFGTLLAKLADAVVRERMGAAPGSLLTYTEAAAVRSLAAASEECMQIGTALHLERGLGARPVVADWHALFRVWCDELADRGPSVCPAAVRVLLGAGLRFGPPPDQVAQIVKSAADCLDAPVGEIWRSAFAVFDRLVQTSSGPRREAWIDRFDAAVHEGARLGHFGAFRSASRLVGAGMPRELRDLRDQWG